MVRDANSYLLPKVHLAIIFPRPIFKQFSVTFNTSIAH